MCATANGPAKMTRWVKSGKSQSEQKFSALHQKAVTYARASSTGGGKAGGVVGVFEKGEEIVFGPDGGLERDTGKDQEIVASALALAEAALRIGSCSQWIALPARCGRAPPLLTTCRRAALPQSAG